MQKHDEYGNQSHDGAGSDCRRVLPESIAQVGVTEAHLVIYQFAIVILVATEC